MRDLDYKTKIEYLVACVILLIGVFFLFQSFTIKSSSEAVGPRTMPLILSISMIVGAFWVALRAATGRAGDLKDGYGFQESDGSRILMVIGCGCLFLFLFWGFGYFAAIAITYIATLYAFGVRSVGWMVGGALTIAVLFQIVFMGVMYLFDPPGAILDLRPYTNWITGAQ